MAAFLKRFINEIGLKPPWASSGPDSSFRASVLGRLLSSEVCQRDWLQTASGASWPRFFLRAPFVRAQDPCENSLLYVSLHVYFCILYMHVHASVRTCVRGRSVFGCVFFPEFRNVSPIIIMFVVFVSRVAGIP